MELLLPLGLLGLGLVLVIAEILFPSLGVLSILATVSIVGSIVLAYGQSSAVGHGFFIATAILVPVTIVFGFKILPNSPMAKYLVAEGFSFEEGSVADARDRGLLGKQGEVVATLRPAGIARLDGRRVDVVSRGESIEVGETVHVVDLRGNRVVVARIEPVNQDS